MKSKNVVAGLGEIGKPIYQLISKKTPTLGFDLNKNLMDKKATTKYELLKTSFLHICIPFSPKFNSNVISLYKKFQPEVIVVHSTVSPHTTQKLQKKLSVPIVYSATRGVHRRMILDLKKYTKFFAVDPQMSNQKKASSEYSKLMKKCGVKTKKMSEPITLELAKIICDTSYYGWLINYAQLSNMIAKNYDVNYDEMWSFSDEIHKYLGNRPKMFPGFIGGHCVIPNLDLMNNETLNIIKKINNNYLKKIPKAKSINHKYEKSKKLSHN